MEQFSLEKYLENPSRKVVTRSGHNVRILCTDQRGNMPIVALVEFETLDGVQIFYSDGKNESHREYDLFFVDNEELTEFEKELQTIISEASHWTSDDGSISTYCQFGDKEIKKISGQTLDLARKEIEKDAVEFAKSYMEDVNPSFEKVQESEELWKWKMSCLRGINKAYTQGKQDALKSLPKWKKATEHKDLEKHIAILEEGKVLLSNYLEEGDYYIDLDDLKTLPKEE